MCGQLNMNSSAIIVISIALLMLESVNASAHKKDFSFADSLKNLKRSDNASNKKTPFNFLATLKNIKRAGTCTYKGESHEQGSKWTDYTDCKDCYCQTGDIVRCVSIKCPVAMCVDFITPTGKCCEVCPNGNNCWLDKDTTITAGLDVMVPMGNCKKWCRCPGESTYVTDGKNTKADCRMICDQQ